MHDRTNPSPIAVMAPATKYRPRRGEHFGSPRQPAMVPRPWSRADQDPARVVTELGTRYPHARIWFGEDTGNYWAFVRTTDGTPRLIEGVTRDDPSRQLDAFEPCALRHHRPETPSGSALRITATRPSPQSVTHQCRPSVRKAIRRTVTDRGRHSTLGTLSRSGRC